MKPLTVAHVTHEACEKIGGIGTVLEGILTSPVYQQHVQRSILIGPFANHLEMPAEERLGVDGEVLYSSVDRIDKIGLSGKLRPIEWAFNVAIIYGTRQFELPGSEDHTGTAEVLLIDVFNANREHVNKFKKRLFEVFNINSIPYESDWGYEEYVRLAEPAYYALMALLNEDELPCVLFSHEFMGLPTAFMATLEGGGQRNFRTVFHAHECATARRLVEGHPGHDTAFYNILHQARQRKQYVEDVFGDQSPYFRHALVSRAHVCDAIVAVGDYTAQEMHFLGDHFDHHQIDMVYNGVPPLQVTFETKSRSRAMLADFFHGALGRSFRRPDVLMTHVMRPVISKAIWRDLQVCHELDARLGAQGKTGALVLLTSAGGTRRAQDIGVMEQEYGWPRKHRAGYPDLCGPEMEFNAMIEAFNAHHQHVQAILVNQFGWSRQLVGRCVPEGMTFADLRRGADIEFGMAAYEPFGISPLEPLGAGAICVISNVCGCAGFVDVASKGRPVENVLVADYTKLDREWPLEELLAMTQEQRDGIEKRVAAELAEQLMQRLPRNDSERRAMLEAGQELVRKMGWDQVLEAKLIPLLRRIAAEESRGSKVATEVAGPSGVLVS